MRKLIAAAMALLGLTSNSQAAEVRMMDPNDILMSIPTISSDLAELEDAGTVTENDLVLHEDDWSQIEFFPSSRLSEMQAKMRELKDFELANRSGSGWKKLYIRKIERMPVVDGPGAVARLESLLGVRADPGPVLTTSGAITGRVKNGFHLSLGGNVAVYGYTQEGRIPVLGAALGREADNTKLATAFQTLNAAQRLILVDWPGQSILIGVADGGKIDVWKP